MHTQTPWMKGLRSRLVTSVVAGVLSPVMSAPSVAAASSYAATLRPEATVFTSVASEAALDLVVNGFNLHTEYPPEAFEGPRVPVTIIDLNDQAATDASIPPAVLDYYGQAADYFGVSLEEASKQARFQFTWKDQDEATDQAAQAEFQRVSEGGRAFSAATFGGPAGQDVIRLQPELFPGGIRAGRATAIRAERDAGRGGRPAGATATPTSHPQTSTKHQIPSTKEAPIIRHQAPIRLPWVRRLPLAAAASVALAFFGLPPSAKGESVVGEAAGQVAQLAPTLSLSDWWWLIPVVAVMAIGLFASIAPHPKPGAGAPVTPMFDTGEPVDLREWTPDLKKPLELIHWTGQRARLGIDGTYYIFQRYSKGMLDVTAGATAVSNSKENEGLTYRGVNTVAQLAEAGASFEEVTFLILHGRQPSAAELAELRRQLEESRTLDPSIVELLRGIGTAVSTMDVLQMVLPHVRRFDPLWRDHSPEAAIARTVWLMGQISAITAARRHLLDHGDVLLPLSGLSYAGQLLYQATGRKPDPLAEDLFNKTLILYAEHGFNNSTYTMRTATSAGAHLVNATVAALGSLKGPYHGGANDAVMAMLLRFKDQPQDAAAWVREQLAKKVKLMGFGHRYERYTREGDPRAIFLEKPLRAYIQHLVEIEDPRATEAANMLAAYDTIKSVMINEKHIHPNVDAPAAIVYWLLGLPTDMNTPIFATSRMSGWGAHAVEQEETCQDEIAPALLYRGPALGRAVTPLAQRGEARPPVATVQLEPPSAAHPDPNGLKGVLYAATAISYTDAAGRRFYRGYSVDDLVKAGASFEEVIHLLIYGELPTEAQLAQLRQKLANYRALAPPVAEVIRLMGREPQASNVMQAALARAKEFDPIIGQTREAFQERAVWLVAQAASISAANMRLQRAIGEEFVEPSSDIHMSHAAQFYSQIMGEQPDAANERLSNTALIQGAEYGSDSNPTFLARTVTSSEPDFLSAIIAGLAREDWYGERYEAGIYFSGGLHTLLAARVLGLAAHVIEHRFDEGEGGGRALIRPKQRYTGPEPVADYTPLASGASIAQAQAQLEAFGRRLEESDASVIADLVAYRNALAPTDARRRSLPDWLRNQPNMLAGKALVAVGLDWSLVVPRLLEMIRVGAPSAGNPRAAARQLHELAYEGTYGGLPAPDVAKAEAWQAWAHPDHPEFEALLPYEKPPTFPVVSATTMPGVLVLDRHGETSWSESVLSRWAGWWNSVVTDKGRQEAFDSGQRLHVEGLTFDAAYASDSSRAVETLQQVLAAIGQSALAIRTNWRLRERHYGDLTGGNRDEIKRTFPTVFQQWRRGHRGNAVRPIGGENLADVQERALPFFITQILADIAAGKNVVVSAHGNSLRAILITLREHTEGRALTEDDVLKLEVPLSTPIVVTFDRALHHEELWVDAQKGPADVRTFLGRRSPSSGDTSLSLPIIKDVSPELPATGQPAEGEAIARGAICRPESRADVRYAAAIEPTTVRALLTTMQVALEWPLTARIIPAGGKKELHPISSLEQLLAVGDALVVFDSRLAPPLLFDIHGGLPDEDGEGEEPTEEGHGSTPRPNSHSIRPGDHEDQPHQPAAEADATTSAPAADRPEPRARSPEPDDLVMLREKFRAAYVKPKDAEVLIAQLWLEAEEADGPATAFVGLPAAELLEAMSDLVIALRPQPNEHRLFRVLVDLAVLLGKEPDGRFVRLMQHLTEQANTIRDSRHAGEAIQDARARRGTELRALKHALVALSMHLGESSATTRGLQPPDSFDFTNIPQAWEDWRETAEKGYRLSKPQEQQKPLPSAVSADPVIDVTPPQEGHDGHITVTFPNLPLRESTERVRARADVIVIGNELRLSGFRLLNTRVRELDEQVKLHMPDWGRLLIEQAIKIAGERGLERVVIATPFTQYRAWSDTPWVPTSYSAYERFAQIPHALHFDLVLREAPVSFTQNTNPDHAPGGLRSRLVWERKLPIPAASADDGYEPPMRITSPAMDDEVRERFRTDPNGMWGKIARREAHWFDQESNAWISFDPTTKKWNGFKADTGEAVTVEKPTNWWPWKHTFSWFDREQGKWKAYNPMTRQWELSDPRPNDLSPLFKYFNEGQTNISYNALDAHVLAGEGNTVIDIVELEPTDEQGQPLHVRSWTYRQRLQETVTCSYALKQLGLKQGDKIVLSIPQGDEWKTVALAAARNGIIYTPPFALRGADEALDQMKELGARVIVTVDGYIHTTKEGAHHHHKAQKIDKILADYDDYVHVQDAKEALASAMNAVGIGEDIRASVLAQYDRPKKLGGFGAPEFITTTRQPLESFIETALAGQQVEEQRRQQVVVQVRDTLEARAKELSIQKVIVFRRTGEQEGVEGFHMEPGRDVWAHDLMGEAEAAFKATASEVLGRSVDDLDALSDADFMQAVSAFDPAVPVESEHPLFIIYTSGSTGKPKGVLHTTAGYMVDRTYAANIFHAPRSGDRIVILADPGWITGHYGLWTMLAGLPTLTYQGSISPARLIEMSRRHGLTLWKFGAPMHRFLRGAGKDLFAGQQLAIRQCMNCAEPGDAPTQAFIDAMLGPGTWWNNWWQTEHGGPYGGAAFGGVHQPPDASIYPPPYGELLVITADQDEEGDPIPPFRVAKPGDVPGLPLLVHRPHPGMMRNLWRYSDRFYETYWNTFRASVATEIEGIPAADQLGNGDVVKDWYLSGDLGIPVEHEGRTHFIVPGRADDVINVDGNRVGTRQIEAGLVEFEGGTVVAEAAVGKRPKGQTETPVAFVQLQLKPGIGIVPDEALKERMRRYLVDTRSPHYVPSEIFFISSIPLTLSGKSMRRFLSYVAQRPRKELRRIIRLLDEAAPEFMLKLRAKDKQAVEMVFPGLGNITSLQNLDPIIEATRVVAAERGLGKPAPAPVRTHASEVDITLYRPSASEEELIVSGRLLPKDATVIPGLTPLPTYRRAKILVKGTSGKPFHGDPVEAIQDGIVPMPEMATDEYVAVPIDVAATQTAIWASLGEPVSVFDLHRQDYHIPGSGGVGMVVKVGSETAKRGLKVGDIVYAFPFKTDPQAPIQARDPSFAERPGIRGYEDPNGMAAEFYVGQAQYAFKLPDTLPEGLTYDHIASMSLNVPTVLKALEDVAHLKPGERLFVEGAPRGTGNIALRIGQTIGARVTGLVSTDADGQAIIRQGAVGAINRKGADLAGIWTSVPEDPAQWHTWEQAGQPLLDAFRAGNEGKLADVVISHAGRETFARDVQLLADGGRLVFYGATSGYDLTFMGKPGATSPARMLDKANLKPGESVLIYYGHQPDCDADGVDGVGVDAIEAALARNGNVVVVTHTRQQEVTLQKSYGDRLKGVISLETLEQDPLFEWRPMPDVDRDKDDFYDWEQHTFKIFGQAVGQLLQTPENPRGAPHVIVERASQNSLGTSARIARPWLGRIIYPEDMSGRRYNFDARSIWRFQIPIHMTSGSILGSHMANSAQAQEALQRVLAKTLPLPDPLVMEGEQFGQGLQRMHESRHPAGGIVFRFGGPKGTFSSKAALLRAMGAEFPPELANQTYLKVTLLPAGKDKDQVAYLMIEDPKTRVNPLTQELLEELRMTFDWLRRNDQVKAVLLTGSGAIFSAGQSIPQILKWTAEEIETQARRAHEVFSTIESFNKPIVIAVNGAAIGGGNELQMTGHLSLAAQTAEFGQGEIRLGFYPGYGGTQRLARLIEEALHWKTIERQGGPLYLSLDQEQAIRVEAARRTARIVLGGQSITAREAQELGIIADVVDDPIATGLELIRKFIETGEGALAQGWSRRRALTGLWNQPVPLPANWATDDPEIQRLLAQGATVGRRKVMEQALETIALGYARGIAAGLNQEARDFGAMVGSDAGKNSMAAYMNKESAPLAPRRIGNPPAAAVAVEEEELTGPSAEEPIDDKELGTSGAGMHGMDEDDVREPAVLSALERLALAAGARELTPDELRAHAQMLEQIAAEPPPHAQAVFNGLPRAEDTVLAVAHLLRGPPMVRRPTVKFLQVPTPDPFRTDDGRTLHAFGVLHPEDGELRLYVTQAWSNGLAGLVRETAQHALGLSHTEAVWLEAVTGGTVVTGETLNGPVEVVIPDRLLAQLQRMDAGQLAQFIGRKSVNQAAQRSGREDFSLRHYALGMIEALHARAKQRASVLEEEQMRAAAVPGPNGEPTVGEVQWLCKVWNAQVADSRSLPRIDFQSVPKGSREADSGIEMRAEQRHGVPWLVVTAWGDVGRIVDELGKDTRIPGALSVKLSGLFAFPAQRAERSSVSVAPHPGTDGEDDKPLPPDGDGGGGAPVPPTGPLRARGSGLGARGQAPQFSAVVIEPVGHPIASAVSADPSVLTVQTTGDADGGAAIQGAILWLSQGAAQGTATTDDNGKPLLPPGIPDLEWLEENVVAIRFEPLKRVAARIARGYKDEVRVSRAP